MTTMNSFDRTPTPSEYRPILRVDRSEHQPVEGPDGECTCPEMCQLDHGN
jgi:hypothetical protein